MNSEIHRALAKKQNVSPNDFTSPVTLRARIERYIMRFSLGYWRSLTRGGMQTKIGSQKFSGNYNSGLNAACFVRSRRQGVPEYVLLPLPWNGKICQARLAFSPPSPQSFSRLRVFHLARS